MGLFMEMCLILFDMVYRIANFVSNFGFEQILLHFQFYCDIYMVAHGSSTAISAVVAHGSSTAISVVAHDHICSVADSA